MNDGDLARTFSSYYIHKYAAISIPEKHIEPQAVAPGQGQAPAHLRRPPAVGRLQPRWRRPQRLPRRSRASNCTPPTTPA
jgi:hypothetical protein